MAYIPRSSFIPKETSGVVPVQARKRRTIHIFGVLSSTLLIASLIAAGVIYFYVDHLNKQLDSSKLELSQISQADNDEKIAEVRTYDHKLNVAHTILDNHIAASHLFEEIENSTKQTIQFESLEYTYDPGFEAQLTLKGKTKEFASVALQKMQFLEDTLFSDFLINQITTSGDAATKDGKTATTDTSKGNKVGFGVKGIFKKDILKYTGEDVPADAAADTNALEEGSTTVGGDGTGTEPAAPETGGEPNVITL
jgi:hypothetical protein